MHASTIEYHDGDHLLEGYIAFDDNSTMQRPLVLIAHAWAGRDQFVCHKAELLAKLGYVGFAWDIYGKGKLGTNYEENSKLMQPFMDDRVFLLRRMRAALETGKTINIVNPNKIAAIGFCFGGLCVLDLARNGANINGVVSFHGLLNPPAELPNAEIKAKILALHGHDDPMVPPEQVLNFQREMTNAKVDWQMQIYGNTVHAFTNPEANDPDFGTVYNSVADSRSWQAMLDFFNEIFR